MTMDNAKRTPKKGDAAILVSVLLVFALVLGGIGLYRFNTGRKSTSWPNLTGKIVYSRAQPHKVKVGHDYLPSVRYTYTLDGETYTGKGITASDVYQKTLSGAKDILRKYPVGAEVSVSYKPDDPTQSVLETGIRKNVYILLGGSALCLVFAAAIVVSRLKAKTSTAVPRA